MSVVRRVFNGGARTISASNEFASIYVGGARARFPVGFCQSVRRAIDTGPGSSLTRGYGLLSLGLCLVFLQVGGRVVISGSLVFARGGYVYRGRVSPSSLWSQVLPTFMSTSVVGYQTVFPARFAAYLDPRPLLVTLHG